MIVVIHLKHNRVAYAERVPSDHSKQWTFRTSDNILDAENIDREDVSEWFDKGFLEGCVDESVYVDFTFDEVVGIEYKNTKVVKL